MVSKSQIDSLPAFRHLLADDTFLLLNPILPVFILPLHLKDAFVHELFVMVVLSDSSSFIEAISSNTKCIWLYAFLSALYSALSNLNQGIR